MKVIFVNWTAPFFFRTEAQGYNHLKMLDLPENEYDIVDYELLIQKVAVKSAKKHIGLTKLYTDKIGFEFYKKKGMLTLWDEIDVDTLENFNKDYPDVNAGKFWTTGKSIIIGKEPIPYLFLDLDFIIRSKLPSWIKNFDLVHTHWEIQRGEIFVFEHQVDKIGGIQDFVQNMMMPNTSFVYMNSEILRDEYLKKHLDLITRKYEKIPEWLWLIADQGIMGYSVRKCNSSVETIENNYYVCYPELPVLGPKLHGKGLYWVKDPNRIDHDENLDYYHVWLDKYYFHISSEFKKNKMEELTIELSNI